MGDDEAPPNPLSLQHSKQSDILTPMTTRHRFIIWGWIVVVVAAGVYAPWEQRGHPVGYHLIFAPWEGWAQIHVDQSRLVIELVIATVIAAGLYVAPLKITPPWPISIGRRLGFQRLYAVLALVWIGIAAFTVLSGKWEPWLRFRTDWHVVASEYGGTVSPTPPSGAEPVSVRFEDLEPIPSRWPWAVGASIIPPLLGYVLLFYVVPWVYRGFRPGTQKLSSTMRRSP